MGIWRQFNKFVLKLDKIPKTWEQCTILFCAFLVDKGCKSIAIRSYISVIKLVLKDDEYHWNDNQMLLTTLTRAGRVVNNTVFLRRPIRKSLLVAILFKVERIFPNQIYLIILYRTLFDLCYYGLFRIGELAKGDHPFLAADISIATNKNKILIILRSSKTHSQESRPQKVKIASDSSPTFQGAVFCPFKLTAEYLRIRGDYRTSDEQFFIFRDGSPVKTGMVRLVFKNIMKNLNLENYNFDLHSFRSGRALDLLRYGYTIEEIKLMGHWKSNAVFRYLKD